MSIRAANFGKSHVKKGEAVNEDFEVSKKLTKFKYSPLS